MHWTTAGMLVCLCGAVVGLVFTHGMGPGDAVGILAFFGLVAFALGAIVALWVLIGTCRDLIAAYAKP